MPERVQMARQHPWRDRHPDAVIVDRRTKWGNPFKDGMPPKKLVEILVSVAYHTSSARKKDGEA